MSQPHEKDGIGSPNLLDETIQTPRDIRAFELLDEELHPELFMYSPLPNSPVHTFNEQKDGYNEYYAVFDHVFSPRDLWMILQGSAPYKDEWPSAVAADWRMWQEKAASHSWLDSAWTDFIPHIGALETVMNAGGDARNIQTPVPDKFLIAVSRWKVDTDGNRTLITEHEQSPRSLHIERLLGSIATRNNLNYHQNRANELAGFAVNMYLNPGLKAPWKPFMNHKGEESDTRVPGSNFIGPAQVITRGLMVRDQALTNSFYKNAEKRAKLIK